MIFLHMHWYTYACEIIQVVLIDQYLIIDHTLVYNMAYQYLYHKSVGRHHQHFERVLLEAIYICNIVSIDAVQNNKIHSLTS